MSNKARDNNAKVIGNKKLKFASGIFVLILLVVFISGCISQAPKVIDQQPDLGVEDENDIDSQIEDLEDLTDDIDDSDLSTLEEDLDSVDWE